MQRLLFLSTCVLLTCFFSCKTEKENTMSNPNNHLKDADSPYLLQHKDNPVNWYPWGDEALEKATEEDKLLIISIGYAACHWCHVMEHESFEDMQVAAVMNKNYVSIKVDREQRPDIDNIYMTAAQIVSGRGGWPLNVIALPDGRPVYAGTYFPKEQWIQMLKFFAKKYRQEPDSLREQAAKITEGIGQVDVVPKSEKDFKYSQSNLDTIWEKFRNNVDFTNGGRQGAPKFPMPDNWKFLMAYAKLAGKSQAKNAVITTLDEMAKGGIYDHIGGGFARYSTDAEWHVPHFEKMLYDNSQLVSLFSHAYQWTKDDRYRNVVYQTLEFVERELTSEEGGFYSSLDADTEGEEGKFYVWTDDEVKDVLGDDAELLMDYYDISNRGNWEHNKNVLRITKPLSEVADKFGLSENEARQKIAEGKKKLFEKRNERTRPGLDDKILTSWNALMLEGYVDAYLAFKEDKYLERALKNARFLKEKMIGKNHDLMRNYKDGNATIDAFLDDYALLINAYIKLYQATFDEQWLSEARALSEYAIANFYDKESGMFFYTETSDTSLIARKMEVSDNVIPSSNSAMAHALFKLGHYFYNQEYLDMANQMLDNVQDQLQSQPSFFSNWAFLMLQEVFQPYEVAITGKDCREVVLKMEDNYLPNVLYLGAESESDLQLLESKFRDETTIFVCQDKVCQQPVTEVDKALTQIDN